MQLFYSHYNFICRKSGFGLQEFMDQNMNTLDVRVWQLRDREIEDHVPLVIVVATCLFFGILGNGFAFAFFRFKRLRSVTDILISFLAATDLVACVIYFDEFIVLFQSFTITNLIGCKVMFVVNNWLTLTSLSFLALIAIDRHRRVCRPLKVQISERFAKMAAVAIATVTFILNLKEVFLVEIVTKHVVMNDNSSVAIYECTRSVDKEKTTAIKVSFIITITTYSCLFVAIIALYAVICRQIRRISLKTWRLKSKRTEENTAFVCEQKEVKVVQKATAEKQSEDSSYTFESKDNKLSDLDQPKVLTEKIESDASTQSVKTESQQKVVQAEKKVTKMVLVFTAISLLSFVPYLVAHFAISKFFITEKNLNNMNKKIARQFYMLNSIVNPYIIYFFNEHFRNFVKSRFAKIACMRLS